MTFLMHPILTANLPQESLAQLPADFQTGIYFGWASVDGAGGMIAAIDTAATTASALFTVTVGL